MARFWTMAVAVYCDGAKDEPVVVEIRGMGPVQAHLSARNRPGNGRSGAYVRAAL